MNNWQTIEAICAHLNDGFKISELTIINMLFETGISQNNLKLENIESKDLFDITLIEATINRLLEMDSHFVAHKSVPLLVAKTTKEFRNENKMTINNLSTRYGTTDNLKINQSLNSGATTSNNNSNNDINIEAYINEMSKTIDIIATEQSAYALIQACETLHEMHAKYKKKNTKPCDNLNKMIFNHVLSYNLIGIDSILNTLDNEILVTIDNSMIDNNVFGSLIHDTSVTKYAALISSHLRSSRNDNSKVKK